MPATLSPAVKRLFQEPNLAHIATLMADGSPQVTPVWVDLDGENIIVNTAEGRAKPRNVRRDPRVALSVTDRNNPYTYVVVRGTVVEITHKDADAVIDSLAKKYLGQDKYPFRNAAEQRVVLVIQPEHVTSSMTG
jgi:PPOX class probable F420-dependent enzyme